MGGEGGIPSNISKGSAHKDMDDQLNYQEHGRYARRAEIRSALMNPDNSYVDILKNVFKVKEPVLTYVTLHWYNPDILSPLTWWKDKQPIEPVIRQGLIEAIDLAEDLPIDSYWVAIGQRNVHRNNYPLGTYRPDEYPLEVILSRSEYQLTRIILTPPSPVHSRPDTFTHPSSIWVVNRNDESQPLGNTEIKGTTAVTHLLEQRFEYGKFLL